MLYLNHPDKKCQQIRSNRLERIEWLTHVPKNYIVYIIYNDRLPGPPKNKFIKKLNLQI